MPSQIVTDKYRRETEKAYTPHDQKEPSDLLERIAWWSHQISQPYFTIKGEESKLKEPITQNVSLGKREGGPAQTTTVPSSDYQQTETQWERLLPVPSI